MKIARSVARIASLFGRIPGVLPVIHAAAIGSLVAAAAFAPAAHAVVVVSPASNIAVPVTINGIYINVVTGATGTAAASVAGWDINPYGSLSSISALNFFSPTTPSGGVYAVSIADQVANLALGSVVGATTPLFGSGAATTTAAASPWVLNATNYFGFRFTGDDTFLHYGYGSMIVGASLVSRRVGNLWYESVAGASITVSPVPEASSTAMLLAGGAAVGAFVQRRRRQSGV